MAKAKTEQPKIDAFAAALEADQTGVKAMYESGALSRDEAMARLRRTQDVPGELEA